MRLLPAVLVRYEALRASGHSTSSAWRTAMVIPASFLIGIATIMYFTSDDSPRGQYSELIAAGKMQQKTVTDSVKKGFADPVTWVLAAQYACCFGVELTVNNTM